MSVPVIDITDLSKSYGKVRGIEHIDLKISEGEIFGFIGPNGSGKTTTIRTLLNLIFPTGGSARILGMDIISETKEIKKHVGYVPSDAGAYSSMDAGEFLMYCIGFHRISNATGRLHELAGLFDLDLKRKISDLSFGNRKKVSIIQSLLHSPRVLIVDEPTTGLDPLMQSVFFDILRSENRKGMSVLFSSHNLAEVQMLCKRVAIIRDGRIIQVEDIANLRKKQLKKVYIRFNDTEEREDFGDPGVIDPEKGPDNSLSFMYSGDINVLIRILSDKALLNLRIEEPSLEEIFMHYYKS